MSWSNIPDAFTINDIGARLLANLARGIYNHEAVLREYVQNACDAYAAYGGSPDHEVIRITIEDNETIAIQDNGIGMNLVDIKACKKIAVSPKAEMDSMTGFRGIGIWAGFQACNQLELITTKAGDKHRYRLQIDFANILEHVNDDINIKTLLDGRFRIEADDAPKEEHYTRVRLVGLQGDYINLTQRQELKRIVSQTLPCKVDPKFEYAEKINEFYGSLEGYQEYSILVEGGEVFKEFPEEVDAPSFLSLGRDGEEYGRVWYCTSSKGRSLPGPTPRDFKYRSFRLRIRNFAVGREGIYDDENASGFGIVNMVNLRSAAHLNWHVGEIHITNPDVRPDTPRSALELDTIARSTIVAIRTFYEDRIADSRALSDFNTCQRDLEKGVTLLSAEEWLDVAEVPPLLERLKEQDSKIRSGRPTDKVKRKLRDLLLKREYKNKLRQTISKLEDKLPKSATSTKGGTSTASNGSRQAGGRAQSTNRATDQQQASQTGAAAASSFNTVDFEQLISDIFAAVKSKLGDDDDLYPEVCQAILDVFKSQGLDIADA
jgi:hypothetical protein